MMYVLIILTGNGIHTGSSTAEFNSLAACEAAVVVLEKVEMETYFYVDGVCVSK